MYEPASLGMFQCRLQRILCDFEVIMFFRKDPPQTEGRRHADLLIKTEPERSLTEYLSRRASGCRWALSTETYRTRRDYLAIM